MICENKDSDSEMAQDTAEGRTETEGTDVAVPPAAAPKVAPGSEEATENSCRSEEDEKKETAAPKVFNRKISVVSAKATSQPAPPPVTGNNETEAAVPARKRRWGASTATTQKKPSISITTESLKNLIPDIKPVVGQDVVLDLHADDTHISEDDNERSSEESSHDKGLKICRTVTQVVQPEAQENGKAVEEEAEAEPEEDPRPRPLPPPTPPALPSLAEIPLPPAPAVQKVTLTDTLIRRSISQQKTGVSITIDDPVRTSHVPSPPRFKVNTIVHISNLVRPFTLGQLKELLGRTGTLIEEGFWIDKIKSHCYVTYSTLEEAIATRNSLHGVKWPQSNPKFLCADYAEQNELDFHKGLLVERPQPQKVEEPPRPRPPPQPQHPRMLPPPALMHRVPERPERTAREQWAEREREMERRERTRAEREWDRDKVREAPPRSRSRSRDRRRKERAKSKEKKSEKKEKAEKAQEEPPAKLLDDLFRKTKTAPCIYWLPLTPDQIIKKEEAREERAKEREKLRKEQEEEHRERLKEREKEREVERAREPEREKRQEQSRDRGGRENTRDTKRRSRSRSPPVRDRGGRR